MPKLLNLPTFIDERGSLTVYDPGNREDLPFEPKRVFWIYHVPKGQERANHAHEICEQVIIPLRGGFVIEIDDERYYIRAHTGLYVEAGCKIRLYAFSENAICLVLCSESYDPNEIQ